jgi:DNA ligase D-like protein (predicted polymerase)
MLPARAAAAPEGADWLHEIKYDGLRAQFVVAGGEARAFSHTGEDWTDRFRPLVAAVEALGIDEAVIDGEVIVQDEAGRSDPAALAAAVADAPERLVLMAFDLLNDGSDLRAAPVEARRARLEAMIGAKDPARPIQFSAHVEGGGGAFFAAVAGLGLDGIVSKRKGSRYRRGTSGDWVAVRTDAALGVAGGAAREDAAAVGPKPIPGTAKGGEPSYKKPRLPEKAAIVDYYRRVAPLLLRFAGHRPLNLFRCTAGHCFFQRNRNHPASGETFGPPVRLLPIAQKNGRTEDYLWIDDSAGVVACAEADGIEFHGWGALVDAVERPDRIAFDLDPGEGTGFAEVKAAAVTLRGMLDALRLASFPLLSGGKGIHVVVPLTPAAEWPEVRGFARRLCAALAEAEPARFTIALPKSERAGRIFLDYLRNQRTATAILPYSLRARAGAPIAAPIAWDELDEVPRASRFTIADAAALERRAGSRALRGWGEAEQALPSLR